MMYSICVIIVLIAWIIGLYVEKRSDTNRIKELQAVIDNYEPTEEKDKRIKSLQRRVFELQAEKHKGFNVDFDKFFAAYDRWKGRNHALKELEKL